MFNAKMFLKDVPMRNLPPRPELKGLVIIKTEMLNNRNGHNLSFIQVRKLANQSG
jgi:hypothetical protein